jgi:hypothetical protein
MTSYAIGGQSSGDFRETSGRVQLFHAITRNSIGVLAPNSFTQANPPVVTPAAAKSSTLANITKVGVLGGSVAFTRPDVGNNFIGGPIGPANTAGVMPLGIFLNDALGNPFENTPGVASGRGPYISGSGSCLGVSVYETKSLVAVGNADISYAVGDKLYASQNGLLTKVAADAYEASNPTLMGIVKIAPDANSAVLVFDLRV